MFARAPTTECVLIEHYIVCSGCASRHATSTSAAAGASITSHTIWDFAPSNLLGGDFAARCTCVHVVCVVHASDSGQTLGVRCTLTLTHCDVLKRMCVRRQCGASARAPNTRNRNPRTHSVCVRADDTTRIFGARRCCCCYNRMSLCVPARAAVQSTTSILQR